MPLVGKPEAAINGQKGFVFTMTIIAYGAHSVNYLFACQPLLIAAFAVAILATVTAATAHLSGHPIVVTGSKVSGFFMAARREYYRRVEGSRHFLKKPAGIANDIAALNEAERLGADRCRIVDTETGIEYTCIIAVIREYGTLIDRGFGQQLALPFQYWIKTAPDGTVTPPTLPKPKPAAGRAGRATEQMARNMREHVFGGVE